MPTISFEGLAPGFFGTSPSSGFVASSPGAGNGFANWPEGVALANRTIQVTSNDGAFAVTATALNLPTGVTESVDGTAVGSAPFSSASAPSHIIAFSGTPAPGTSALNSGKYSAAFSAANSSGESATLSLGITVEPPPVVFTPGNLLDDGTVLPYTSGTYDDLVTATVGSQFSYTVTAATATGTPAPVSTSSAPGNGIDVQVNGNSVTISGNPTAAGYYDINLSAAVAASSNTDAILLAVEPSDPVTSPTFYWQLVPSHTAIDPLGYNMGGSNGTAYNFSGSQTVGGESDNVTSSLVITQDQAAYDRSDNFAPNAPPAGYSNSAVSTTITFSNAPPANILPGETFTIGVSTNQPSGIGSSSIQVLEDVALNSQISGLIPTTSGTGLSGVTSLEGFTVTAPTSSSITGYFFGEPYQSTYTIQYLQIIEYADVTGLGSTIPVTVYNYELMQGSPGQGTAPQFNPPASTTFTVGTPGSFPVTASGSPAPTFTQSGAPSWVNLSPSGTLTGTPPADSAPSYTFTITASNSVGSVNEQFTLNVGPPTDKWTGQGNDDNWDDDANWSLGKPQAGWNLTFPAQTNHLDSTDNMPGLVVNNIELDDNYSLTQANSAVLSMTGNITVNSGSVECALPITLSGGTDTFTIAQNATFTLGKTTLGGSAQLVKAGAGELVFSPSSSFSGPIITLQAGNLGLGFSNLLGNAILGINGTAPMGIISAFGAEKLTIGNELDLVQGTLAFQGSNYTITGDVVVLGDTELDAPTGSSVNLKGAVSTPRPVPGSPALNFLTVAGSTTNNTSSFVLNGALGPNTTVIVKQSSSASIGAGLSGKGTIAVDGTLIADTNNGTFLGNIFLQNSSKLQLIDSEVLAPNFLGLASVTVYAGQSTPAVVQTIQEGDALHGSTPDLLGTRVEINGSNASPPTAGLVIQGSLTLSGPPLTLDTPCELTLASNTILTLNGNIALGQSANASTNVGVNVQGPGQLNLGGNLGNGIEVGVLETATVELVGGFAGSGTLTVNGGKLLSKVATVYKGQINLIKGTIEADVALGALGDGSLLIDAAAAPATAPAATLQGNTSLFNTVEFDSTSGPLGIGPGSALSILGPVQVELGAPQQVFLAGAPPAAAGTQLALYGGVKGTGATLLVGGGSNSDLVIVNGPIDPVVRAVTGGTVRVGSHQAGTVVAAGGTVAVLSTNNASSVAFTNRAPGITLRNLAAIEGPAGGPADVPVGYFSFTLSGIVPGKTATVTITLPAGATATGFYSLGQQPTKVDHNGNTVTLTFVAGASGTVQVKGAPTGSLPAPAPPPPPVNPNVAKVTAAFGAFSPIWGKIFG